MILDLLGSVVQLSCRQLPFVFGLNPSTAMLRLLILVIFAVAVAGSGHRRRLDIQFSISTHRRRSQTSAAAPESRTMNTTEPPESRIIKKFLSAANTAVMGQGVAVCTVVFRKAC